MENRCIVNKQSVAKSKALKQAQKSSRKYYQEKLFQKAVRAPKAKIRKLSDLNTIGYQSVAEMALDGEIRQNISREELIQLCKKSHLTGRSGNGFEVARKIEAWNKEKGTLLINAVECDPGLVTDSWLYRNKKTYIKKGAEILRNALGVDRVILATKEPIKKIEGVEQVKVIDRFPMGYEKILIRHILDINVPAEKLPQDQGILVMNLQTVIAIAELTQNEMAGYYKYITIHNLRTAKSQVLRVHIGDMIKTVVQACCSKEDIKDQLVYAGSGALNCHEAVKGEVIGDTTGYIALGQMPSYEIAGRCKGCGACTQNCPAGVKVQKIVAYVEKNGRKDANKCVGFHASACIGCGGCSYGCRAGKDVREMVKWAKEAL